MKSIQQIKAVLMLIVWYLRNFLLNITFSYTIYFCPLFNLLTLTIIFQCRNLYTNSARYRRNCFLCVAGSIVSLTGHHRSHLDQVNENKNEESYIWWDFVWMCFNIFNIYFNIALVYLFAVYSFTWFSQRKRKK